MARTPRSVDELGPTQKPFTRRAARVAGVMSLGGVVVALAVGFFLWMAGPPMIREVAAPPVWGDVPIGYPVYPHSPRAPGAGYRTDGASGMAYSADRAGRSYHRTSVVVMEQKVQTIFRREQTRFGWPWHCIEVVRFTQLQQGLAGNAPLEKGTAFRLLVPTVFADAGLYSLVGVMCWAVGGSMRREHRRSHGLCTNCAYPLRHASRCPECGASA